MRVSGRLYRSSRSTVEAEYAFLPEVFAKTEKAGLSKQEVRAKMQSGELPRITLKNHGHVVKRAHLDAWVAKVAKP